MMKYYDGKKKSHYMDYQTNERTTHSKDQNRQCNTFLGSNVLSSPINQKLSESADPCSQLPVTLLDPMKGFLHPENQVGYTMAGDSGCPKVL